MKEALKQHILANSVSTEIETAIDEWTLCGQKEDQDSNTFCLCNQPHLRYLYEIRNIKNNKILFPIGSSCIKTFENERLNNELHVIDYGMQEFKQGKYKGMKIMQIVENHADYVEFIIAERKNSKKEARKNNDYLKLASYYKLIKASGKIDHTDIHSDDDDDDVAENSVEKQVNVRAAKEFSGECEKCGKNSTAKNGVKYQYCLSCTSLMNGFLPTAQENSGKCEICHKNSTAANGVKYRYCFMCNKKNH